MSYAAVFLYVSLVLIRPQEWWAPLNGIPIILFSLLFALLAVFVQKRVYSVAPQMYVVFGLVLMVMASVTLATGSLSEALRITNTFFSQSFVPFLVVSFLVDTVYRQKLIMLVCIVAACLMVHNGMTQLASPDGLGWTNTAHLRGRVTYIGIFSDPNDMGMFLVMVMPFIAYFMYKQGAVMKLVWVAALLWLCFGVHMTNSRGTLLGVFSLLGSLFLVKYGWKKSLMVGLVLAPVAFVVMSSFREIGANDESSQGRLDAWYAGYQMLKGSPLWGVGQSLFSHHHYLTAHNSVVQVMGEMGFLGLFLWVALIFLSIKMLLDIVRYLDIDELELEGKSEQYKKRVKDEVSGNKEMSFVLLFSYVGYGVTAFWLSRAYAPVLYIYSGLAVATYYRSVVLSPEFSRRNYSQYWGVILKICLGLIVGINIFIKLVG